MAMRPNSGTMLKIRSASPCSALTSNQNELRTQRGTSVAAYHESRASALCTWACKQL